jgi:hypothetical protein
MTHSRQKVGDITIDPSNRLFCLEESLIVGNLFQNEERMWSKEFGGFCSDCLLTSISAILPP